MIADTSEMFNIARKIFNSKIENEVYFLSINSNELIAKVGVNLFKSLERVVIFDNVTCLESIAVTQKSVRQECILIKCIQFNKIKL